MTKYMSNSKKRGIWFATFGKTFYMKSAGIFILICGIIALCSALYMDTAIDYVENIGLLTRKTNWVIISGFACLIGSVFIAFGNKDEDTALLRRIILKLEEQVDEIKKQTKIKQL